MWSRVQVAGSRAKAPGTALERLPTLSKLPTLRENADDARSYVVASVALVIILLTCALALLGPSRLNLFKPLTEFADHHPATAVTTQLGSCDAQGAKLKVFMYDLPAEFHYGMITEFQGEMWPRNESDIPRYPGGLYQQHSPEYWLITDVLTSDMPDRSSPCTAFRVRRWQDADVVLVPFFASLSYNRYHTYAHQWS